MAFRSSFSDKFNRKDTWRVPSDLWFPIQVHISKQLSVGSMACVGIGDHPVKARENFYKLIGLISARHTSFYSPFIRTSWLVKGTSKAP